MVHQPTRTTKPSKALADTTLNQNLRLYERGHDPAARIGRITLEEERLKAPSIRNVQNEPFLVAIGDKCEKFFPVHAKRFKPSRHKILREVPCFVHSRLPHNPRGLLPLVYLREPVVIRGCRGLGNVLGRDSVHSST